jgi:cytochrome P450
LARPNNTHVAFIHGIHFCLGAPLARMEDEVVLGKILERYPRFAAGAEPAVRKTDAIISRGWLTRPVALTGGDYLVNGVSGGFHQ